MNKNFYIKTFGCQMNFNDSYKISYILIKENFKKTDFVNQCDIIIINTCSIRENSHKKIYFYLNKIYNKYNNLLFILIGCLSSFLSIYLLNKFNFIKIILGPHNIHLIYKLIQIYYFNNCKQISINFYKYKNNKYNFYDINNISNTNINNYISITEGCNKYCSYCIVPYTRGNEVSFNLNLILTQILNLNKINIFLLGQNVSSYNSKINNYNKYINFFTLLNYISQIYIIKNINFITSHPQDFTKILIVKLNNIKKLSNFIHLPIQSCSNKILNLMRRNYNLKKIKTIIYKLKFLKKNIFISTDIIVGFCEEYKCDFYKTIVFLEKFLFDKSYIFLYSPRPYTKSYYFFNKLNKNTKIKRFSIVEYKIRNNVFYINKLMLNKVENVLIKTYYLLNTNMFLGFTCNNRIIKFIINNLNFLNYFILEKNIKLKILNYFYDIFYGEILY